MNKIISLVIFITLFTTILSGCIKLQMPDDMISDTVDVIKGDDDEAQIITPTTNTFTHSVVGASNTSVAELTQTCLSELEARARTLFGQTDLILTVVSKSVWISGDKAIASCAASIG